MLDYHARLQLIDLLNVLPHTAAERKKRSLAQLSVEELISIAIDARVDLVALEQEYIARTLDGVRLLKPGPLEDEERRYPYYPFKDELELNIAIEVAGVVSKRRVRVHYSWRPDWPFFCERCGQDLPGLLMTSISIELRTKPRRGEPSEWVQMGEILNSGVLSDAAHRAIDKAIDRECRAEDKRRRAAAANGKG